MANNFMLCCNVKYTIASQHGDAMVSSFAVAGEQTFSSQSHATTYLRSMMTKACYNNLMVLHVNKDRSDKRV